MRSNLHNRLDSVRSYLEDSDHSYTLREVVEIRQNHSGTFGNFWIVQNYHFVFGG